MGQREQRSSTTVRCDLREVCSNALDCLRAASPASAPLEQFLRVAAPLSAWSTLARRSRSASAWRAIARIMDSFRSPADFHFRDFDAPGFGLRIQHRWYLREACRAPPAFHQPVLCRAERRGRLRELAGPSRNFSTG